MIAGAVVTVAPLFGARLRGADAGLSIGVGVLGVLIGLATRSGPGAYEIDGLVAGVARTQRSFRAASCPFRAARSSGPGLTPRAPARGTLAGPGACSSLGVWRS